MNHRARPNIYTSTAELNQRLLAQTLTPRPQTMSELEATWQDMERQDRATFLLMCSIFAVCCMALYWLW